MNKYIIPAVVGLLVMTGIFTGTAYADSPVAAPSADVKLAAPIQSLSGVVKGNYEDYAYYYNLTTVRLKSPENTVVFHHSVLFESHCFEKEPVKWAFSRKA